MGKATDCVICEGSYVATLSVEWSSHGRLYAPTIDSALVLTAGMQNRHGRRLLDR